MDELQENPVPPTNGVFRQERVKHYEAVIVGGGVIGSAIAYYMASGGMRVALLDRGQAAGQASGAAAGMLAAQAETEEPGPLFDLARTSREMFPELAGRLKELSGIDIGLVNRGMLKIATSEQEAERYRRIVGFQQSVGEQAEWLTGEEAVRLEPRLSARICGAMYLARDGQVSAPDLTEAFAKSAAALGADLYPHTEAQAIHIHQGQAAGVMASDTLFTADYVVVAGGVWSRALLKSSGLTPVPVYPVKGECVSVLTRKPLIASTIFSHGCYLVPKRGGRIVIGATMEENRYDPTVSVEGMMTLLERAKRIVPDIANTEWEKAWAGLRPQSADGLPYLGEHPECPGLYVACGHYRNGILLSPVTGDYMTRLVLNQLPHAEAEHYRVDRHWATVTSG